MIRWREGSRTSGSNRPRHHLREPAFLDHPFRGSALGLSWTGHLTWILGDVRGSRRPPPPSRARTPNVRLLESGDGDTLHWGDISGFGVDAVMIDAVMVADADLITAADEDVRALTGKEHDVVGIAGALLGW